MILKEACHRCFCNFLLSILLYF